MISLILRTDGWPSFDNQLIEQKQAQIKKQTNKFPNKPRELMLVDSGGHEKQPLLLIIATHMGTQVLKDYPNVFQCTGKWEGQYTK